MKPNEYIEAAKRTNATHYRKTEIKNGISLNTLHMSLGMVTESAELQDMLKKTMMYGKPLDVPNLIEEVGDCLWYIAGLLDEHGYSFEEVMQTNIDKLKARFPNKFTQEDALNRDLETERKILEEGADN